MRALDSPAQMEAVLLAAVAAGINHIETAPAYGPAETFLGQALAALERRDRQARAHLVLTSKLLPGPDLSTAQAQLRACLKRLGVARLDNLAVHGLNTADHLDWALRGPGAELLAWAEGEGLAVQVGFSSHGSNDLIAAALESGRFGFCCLHLHLFDPQRLPLARAALEAGLGVLAISPADKGGRLYDPPPELLADCAPFQPLELAYRVLLEQGISTLSLGASQPGDLAWARRLTAAAGPRGQLSPDEVEPGPEPAPDPGPGSGSGPGSGPTAVDLAVERLRASAAQRLGEERCGQCRACLPCPSAVPIPELLRLRNLAVGHGMVAHASERYNLIGRAGHWWETLNAEACRQCGACLPRCPHGLPIPDLLADTHRRLAAAPRRRLWG
ncbi:aldo/keto reductase [Synechococcus sp. CCY9202]|uniref:aldo/keto reductase n=1 Tax=Synechococcus sp. CCY9202 TaxID=174698 RepID=UPI002B2004CF|nr:aldo/keto reductase [Synechococcus sp. CCY9202]MEA5422232.1 aldo/keto reductase [Synechococcus sp. CCY9202]